MSTIEFEFFYDIKLAYQYAFRMQNLGRFALERHLTLSLQWTYDTANSWGTCRNGTDAMGCGPQETFRACSDIKISKRGPRPGSE